MIDFLIILALVWLVVASISDLKKREVPNWLNFSFITFALAYRAFYSVIEKDSKFFIYGVFGFLLCFGLAYLFYYSRIFAGGDAKLLMGLGAILPFSETILDNVLVFFVFILLLLSVGGIYGVVYSSVLAVKNRKRFAKEFRKQAKERKNLLLLGIALCLLSLILIVFFKDFLLLVFSAMIALSPVLFIYAKSVEESCMIIEVPGKNLTVGDWLYQEVNVGRKKIKPNWEGLSEKEVEMLKNVRKVKIKQGIPFVPVFLISFVLLILLKDYFLNSYV